MRSRWLSVWVALACVAACSKDQPAPRTPVQPVAAQPQAPQPTAPVAQPPAPNVAVSDELMRKCVQRFGRQAAPTFGFDDFQLDGADRDLLTRIASCVTTGPLKGRALTLTGHADPRGTDEYNLGLGDRRAHTVGDYLMRLGVAADRVSATTRGELDASGSDETTWQRDRRVDVELRN
jgi:peptidoglycan-associated lipoprotein